MASTLGHAICGIDCLLLGRGLYPQYFPPISISSVSAFILLANLPDFDLLLGPLIGERPLYFHGQMTHSVVFAICIGLLLHFVKIASKRSLFTTQNAFLIGFIAVFSHIVVDLLTGPEPGLNPSFGIKWAWPFIDQRLHAPVTFFLGPHHASMIELLSWHNVIVMVSELLIFGGAGILLILMNQKLRCEFSDFIFRLGENVGRFLARSNN